MEEGRAVHIRDTWAHNMQAHVGDVVLEAGENSLSHARKLLLSHIEQAS